MELKATTRKIFGKKVKLLRQAGLLPAELFGSGVPNEHLSVSKKEFIKVYREAGEHELVTIDIEGGKKIPVLITDAVRNALSNEFFSVDFHAVKMDEKIRVKIPLVFEGEAPAIKNGFPVIKVVDEIEIETFPGKMPHSFTVNLAVLDELGKSIHMSDIKIPKDVRVFLTDETVIATVGEKAKAEEVVAPVVPAPVATPEVEATPTEKK
ncbi:MAG: 50S ribosomal protein L25 [Candidatus Paceibacterota bacterium]|jgi:large subunit ribosomal protein L25